MPGLLRQAAHEYVRVLGFRLCSCLHAGTPGGINHRSPIPRSQSEEIDPPQSRHARHALFLARSTRFGRVTFCLSGLATLPNLAPTGDVSNLANGSFAPTTDVVGLAHVVRFVPRFGASRWIGNRISSMTVLRIAAFSDGNKGGNPAGIWIGDDLPPASKMQAIAADVGFSETAFAAPEGGAWRVRYFSPLCEVPFCGHATIALGAALALQHGDRTFELKLNRADISVAGRREGHTIAAALQSPPTRSVPIDPLLQANLLQLLDYSIDDLDLNIPPAKIHGGADHVVLALKTRNALARMSYDLKLGRELMEEAGLVTVALVTTENPQLFHVRNAFAVGGVLEDPATGAAAAAFAGYLRDIGWPHGGVIDIVQGEDMGMRSLIRAEIREIAGSSIRVSGTARIMNDA